MKQKKTTLTAMIAAAFILLILANIFHGVLRIVFYGLSIFALAMFAVLWSRAWRCPNCGKHLGRLSDVGDTCPHCKQKLP